MPKYIDADALNAELEKVFEGTDYEFDNDLLNDVLSAVDNAPAADVEPVRRGRWIPINRINPAWGQFGIAQHKCSECGSEEMIARKRCPECGAKMEV